MIPISTASPFLAKALAQGGDGSHANIAAAQAAVNCADMVAPTKLATYDEVATRLERLEPKSARPRSIRASTAPSGRSTRVTVPLPRRPPEPRRSR